MSSSLAQLQRALDLYGAAAYWAHCAERDAAAHHNDAENLAGQLWTHAADAGCSGEQLTDALSYAESCARAGRKPLAAGLSFPEFQRLHQT